MTREPDTHADIPRISDQERIEAVYRRFGPDEQKILNILTDPAIEALGLTPADFFSLAETSMEPDLYAILDSPSRYTHDPTLPGLMPESTEIMARIRQFLPIAESLTNLTVTAYLTKYRISNADFQYYLEKHQALQLAEIPAEVDPVLLKPIMERPPVRSDGKDPVISTGHHIPVTHSPYESLRNDFMATLLGYEFLDNYPNSNFIGKEPLDSLKDCVRKFLLIMSAKNQA